MKRSFLLFIFPLLIVAYPSFIFFQQGCDNVMYPEAEKGIPFTHQTHLSGDYDIAKDDCSHCHGYDDNGRFSGTPTVGTCMDCHQSDYPKDEGYTGKPKPFLKGLKDSDKPWGSHAKQPDLVYFSHKVVMTAQYADGRKKARCGSCHGDKASSMSTKRIKGKMLMGQCMDCHTALRISNKCAVCHD
ncbi:MAG: cytochrome c3 family protein [bacterium]|nr:cytochrome c3 family protein [bacterium]